MSPMSAKTSINREDDAMRARLATTLILISLIPLTVQAAPLLRGKHAIANQNIVQIKPDEVRRSNDVSASDKSRPTVFEFAVRRAKAHGAKLERVFEYALKGFSARMTPQQAEALAADPSVLLVVVVLFFFFVATEVFVFCVLVCFVLVVLFHNA